MKQFYSPLVVFVYRGSNETDYPSMVLEVSNQFSRQYSFPGFYSRRSNQDHSLPIRLLHKRAISMVVFDSVPKNHLAVGAPTQGSVTAQRE